MSQGNIRSAEMIFRFPSVHSELPSPRGVKKKKERKVDRKCLCGGGHLPFPFAAATCADKPLINPVQRWTRL